MDALSFCGLTPELKKAIVKLQSRGQGAGGFILLVVRAPPAPAPESEPFRLITAAPTPS